MNKRLNITEYLIRLIVIALISLVCINIVFSFTKKDVKKFGKDFSTTTFLETESTGELVCNRKHEHLKICYIKEISEIDRSRVIDCFERIDEIPEYEEIEEKLKEYENALDDEGYQEYYIETSDNAKEIYLCYEELKDEKNDFRQYVENLEKLLKLKSMWEAREVSLIDGESPYPVKVNAFNNGDKVALIYGTSTVYTITKNNFTYWQGYNVVKSGDDYVVKSTTAAPGNSKGSITPPTNGFILFFYQEKKYKVNVGDYIVLDFDYKTVKEGIVKVLTENEYQALNKKPDVNNNLVPITTISTKDTIKINLYNYGNSINDRVANVSKNYPLFKFYKASQLYNITSSYAYSFSENIITNLDEGTTSTTVGINQTKYGNSSIDGALAKKLNSNGYPVLATGESIGYLFGEENLSYVKKMNPTENIDGLLQYNEATGQYYFDSRKNFAKYNQTTNKFELYNEILTPNFIEYPFGNFMPWEDIQIAKKVSTINKEYFNTIEKSCYYKAKNSDESQSFKNAYSTLGSTLNNFSSKMDTDSLVTNKNWNYIDILKRYAKTLSITKGYTDALYNNTEHFEKLYNVDYDEKKNFHFGMTMEFRFIAHRVDENNNDIEYYFNGDDDVLVYIDDVLFIELAGTHRQVGAKINFTKGTVTYYDFDTTKGDVSSTPSTTRTSKTFKQIISEANADIELTDDTNFVEGTKHVLKFFFLERGAGSSLCNMTFNMVVEPNRGDIEGTKFWDGDEGYEHKRPAEVIIDLYKDGVLEATTTTNAEKEWKYKFEGLVFATPSGKEYNYDIKERDVPNYETIYENNSPTVRNIRNIYKVRDVVINKIWEDNDDKLNLRPDKIEVELDTTVNGNPYDIGINKIVELTKENGYSVTLENLPKYVYNEDSTKTEIKYSIKESIIPEGYYLSEIKEEAHTFTLTNVKYRNIEITKVDKNDHEIKLENAVFTLEKMKNVNEKDETFTTLEGTTDSSGKLLFSNLEFGDYRLTEINSPKGYSKSKQPILISVTKDDIIFKVEVENKKGASLAITGGDGDNNFLTYGMILICISILFNMKKDRILLIHKKKKGRNPWNVNNKISKRKIVRKDRWNVDKMKKNKIVRKDRWSVNKMQTTQKQKRKNRWNI